MKKYRVVVDRAKLSFTTDNPLTAIKRWIRYSSSFPQEAYIICYGGKEDYLALYRRFVKSDFKFEIPKYWKQMGCKLDYNYIYTCCLLYGNGTKSFSSARGGYVYPFVMG